MPIDTNPEPATAVYIANARSNELLVFSLDRANGRLDPVQRLPVPGSVTPLALSPNRDFLYAGLRGDEPSVCAFAIDPSSGRLDLIADTRVADPPMFLATDRSGQFLFSASYAAASLCINAILSDGSVAPTTVARTQTPPQAHGVFIDPTNRFLFVTSLGGDVILQYFFDASTGLAKPNAVPFIATPKGSGPRHIAYQTKDAVLFVNGELDAGICSYALSSDTGRLRALHREATLTDATVVPWAAELALTPDGRFLYASERRSSTLAVFELCDEPGALARRAIISTEEQPRSFAIDARGRFLIVAGEKSNFVTAYAIDSTTGALTAQHRCAVGDKPTWVSIVDLSHQRARTG